MGRVSHDLEEVQYITFLPHLDCHARYEKVDMYLLHMHFFLGLQPNLTCVTAVSCTGMEGEICTAIQQSAPHFWISACPFHPELVLAFGEMFVTCT